MPITVLLDWLRGLNRELFYAVNGIRGDSLDFIMLLGTRIGDFWNAPWIIFAMLCFIAIRRFSPKSAAIDWLPEQHTLVKTMLVFLAGFVLAAMIVALIKIGYDKPRPLAAMTLGTVHVLAQRELNHSFPSGHAAFAMLIVSVFWPYCRYRWRALLVLFAMWVGISRVSVGAHFPIDVIAGYLCGGVSGWVAANALTLLSSARFVSRRI
ncbi:phosphatase PAP2 family protein [Methylobacter sp.]|jgi:membrane-associated phospholipid phosphatase|uniref:phosphatase PAP2 family protein n=1 Tax=Methylobacter sp. TaxID=2051955 RepID=UPI003DA4E3E6